MLKKMLRLLTCIKLFLTLGLKKSLNICNIAPLFLS